jgi:hypothetical protein
MKRLLAYVLTLLGALALLAAALAAVAMAVSLAERSKYGPGLMFADVEIFAVLAFFLGGAGGALLWVGRRLGRRPVDEPQANQP